ncbi:MAG: hypothetical protein RLZZ535_2094, partial [Cyanobacteriota bacterium]
SFSSLDCFQLIIIWGNLPDLEKAAAKKYDLVKLKISHLSFN